jgi:hypothetical protein
MVFQRKPGKPLAEKDTLSEYLMLLVLILLVCKHPDSLNTNIINPFGAPFLIEEKPRPSG